MRLIATLLATAAVLLGLNTTDVDAATIRVARDGSGEFSVLAEAVLAASSGDTVTIAPGVYPEVQTFDTPGGPAEYVAEVEIAELTIIGDDRDTVILGPEVPAENLERGPGGIVTSTSGNVRVRGVTVRNTHAGVWGNDQWVDVQDCRFVGNEFGVAADMAGFATVRDCEILECEDAGVMVFVGFGSTGALVENCSFRDNALGTDFQPQNCEVRDCSFDGEFVGLQVSFGGSVRVERCTFDNIGNIGLNVTGGSQAYLYDSNFADGMPANVSVIGLLVGSGNELLGGSVATLGLSYSSAFDFHGNHIFNGGALSILTNDAGTELRVHDFSNNYWGTTDTDQIDEWIHDHNDEPVVNQNLIDYLPIAEQPVSTESTSFGELKSRYGQE